MMRNLHFRSKPALAPDSGDGASNHDHPNDHLGDLQEKVFQNPAILEVILMHILQRNISIFGYPGTYQFGIFRLVCKTWLLEVNFLFQRHGIPFVRLSRRNLKQFMEIYESRQWGTPPISLSLGPKDLLSPDFCQDLNQCFRMGHLLAKLTVLKISAYPFISREMLKENGDADFGLAHFPTHFKCTSLRKVWLKQLVPPCKVEDDIVSIPRWEECLQRVLDQSEILEEFKFEGDFWRESPSGQLEGLTLPRTVKFVEVDTRLNLTRILGNDTGGGCRVLEGITVLKLKVTSNFLVGVAEMEGILEGLSVSLEELQLEMEFWKFVDVDIGPPEIGLKFPVMGKLKRMRVKGRQWRIERSQVLNGLGDRFPRLEGLELDDFSDEPLLNDWCGEKSVFGGVKTLKLNLKPVREEDFWVGMSEDKMRRILNAFPNVEELRMGTFDLRDMEGVRYMFGTLGGQLKKLHLKFEGTLGREEEMEGLLIGGDVEMVRRLKRKSGGKFWEEYLEGVNGVKSLRDLVKLEELVLAFDGWTVFRNGWFWKMVRRPRVIMGRFGCEMLFKAGFMRMPNLRKLKLRGGLSPGKELAGKWLRQGIANGRSRELDLRKVPRRKRDLWWLVRNW